jgi:hypothetical protein
MTFTNFQSRKQQASECVELVQRGGYFVIFGLVHGKGCHVHIKNRGGEKVGRRYIIEAN